MFSPSQNYVEGSMYYFVGDGSETISAHAWEKESIEEARRLNRENETTEYVSYAREMGECDERTAEYAALKIAGII